MTTLKPSQHVPSAYNEAAATSTAPDATATRGLPELGPDSILWQRSADVALRNLQDVGA